MTSEVRIEPIISSQRCHYIDVLFENGLIIMWDYIPIIQELGQLYFELPDTTIGEDYKRELAQFLKDEFATLDLNVYHVDYHPYQNVEEIGKDIENKQLRVSTLFNESTILDSDTNLKFRAIHDYQHHILKAPFNFCGEYLAFQYLASLLKNEYLKKVIFSEIVLQAAAYYCIGGDFPEEEKIVICDEIIYYDEALLREAMNHFSYPMGLISINEKDCVS